MSSSLLVQGGYLSHGSLMTCFRQEGRRGRVRVPFLPFSQTPSAQDIQYIKVPYLGITCPEPYQIFLRKCINCQLNTSGSSLVSVLSTKLLSENFGLYFCFCVLHVWNIFTFPNIRHIFKEYPWAPRPHVQGRLGWTRSFFSRNVYSIQMLMEFMETSTQDVVSLNIRVRCGRNRYRLQRMKRRPTMKDLTSIRGSRVREKTQVFQPSILHVPS